MRIRDGPAAVRGVAPPPRSHWRKPGRRRGREPRVRRPVALPYPEPLAEGRIQVLRLAALVAARGGARSLRLRRRSRPAARSAPASFPVTVIGSNGKVTVSKRPARIVSLSPTATETLFAIGAGSQVVAVDDQSDFPKSAPQTSLSGFTPNVEAIAAYRPDLVVIAYDPKGLVGRARPARHHGAPPGRCQELQGRVPADPAARARHRPRGAGDEADRRHEGEDREDRRRRAEGPARALRLPRARRPTSTRRRRRRSSARSTRRSACGTSPTRPTRSASATRSSRPSTSSRRAPT